MPEGFGKAFGHSLYLSGSGRKAICAPAGKCKQVFILCEYYGKIKVNDWAKYHMFLLMKPGKDCINHDKMDKERMNMTIEKKLIGNELTITLTGRLDTTTAPQLESELKASLEGVDNLVLDFAELDYLSSAGLRVLLAAQKTMNKQGSMVVRHVNETIAEIFDVTGFCDILTIE